ncbi:unnamed protein product, partial [marine sediment metagenome]
INVFKKTQNELESSINPNLGNLDIFIIIGKQKEFKNRKDKNKYEF